MNKLMGSPMDLTAQISSLKAEVVALKDKVTELEKGKAVMEQKIENLTSVVNRFDDKLDRILERASFRRSNS